MTLLNAKLIILVASILLQLVATLVAIRIMRMTGHIRVGLFIIAAIALMAFRRALALAHALYGEASTVDLLTEIVALAISGIMLAGVLYVEQLIRRLQAAAHAAAATSSERSRFEQTLKRSEERYHDLFENANDAIFLVDSRKNYVDVNRKAIELLGYSREELLRMNIFDLIPEEQKPRSTEEFGKLERQGQYEKFRGRVRTRDGRLLDVEVSSSAIMEDGRYMGSRDILRDISQEVVSERLLRESEMRLKKAQQIGHIGNWAWDMATNQLTWSEEVFRLYGLDPVKDKPSYETVISMLAPECREAFSTAIEKSIRHQVPFDGRYRIVRPDGSERHTHTVGEIIRDRNGKPLSMFGIVQDVTAEIMAEEAIKKSEHFIRTILDTVDEGFIVMDRDFRILIANNAYGAQSGISSQDAIGRHCYEISHRTDRPCFETGEQCAVQNVFRTGQFSSAIHRHPSGTGGMLYVETKAFPIKDSAGEVQSVIETVNNITEKHLLEEERLKTQKLEAIGTLAGGIAHDFNNLLQGVFGYISMAKMTLDQKERSQDMLDQAEQALHLSVNLTKQLLTFSKGGAPVKKTVSLKPVIENSVRFALSGSRADYRLELDKDLLSVDADEGQLAQVIQNVVLNADQAMPLGGTVSITARNVRVPGNLPPHFLPEGRYVRIDIQDTGVGISEQFLPRIFDPYFTTKEKGSGLGLATSYSIIRNHGGVIEVRSEIDRGTTFSILLHGIEGQAAARQAPERIRSVLKGRILVMDDEELVRNITGEMIRAGGHDVEFAENGETALEKYKAARDSGQPFDVVILDLTVRGGMGGREAVSRLRALDPGVKAIVSSGYSGDAIVSDFRSFGFQACLTKPYHVQALHRVLNQVLASEPGNMTPD